MTSISCARCAVLVAGLSLFGAGSSAVQAQAQEYPPIDPYALVGGYVPEGTRGEVSGFIGANDGGIGFKYAPMSAQHHVTVVTTRLPADLLARIAARCAWNGITVGMCKATVRGTVMSKTSRSIMADDIVIE